MQSRLNREPVVVQEPEASLLDGQVCVLNAFKVRAKGMVSGEARRLAWPVHALFVS